MWHPPGGMRTPDRGSTTGNASWTDREPASGLPRRGERSESIPPHRHILRRARTQVRAFFSHVAPTGGMRTPDRGSTTGAASWTDREPASGLPRRGERSESIPPHRHIQDESLYASTGSFLLYSLPGGGAPREKPIPKLILLHPLILFAEVVHQRPDGGQQPAP